MIFLKRIRKKILRRDSLLNTDIRMMRLLDIAESGVDVEDTPYVRLRSGEVFYSFLPTERERMLYSEHKDTLSRNLFEDCFRVALDVIQRYYRENSASYIPPKTHHLYPGWGFIDLGAYIGFGTIKAARKVSEHGLVVAVEAYPQAYALLVKNVKANGLNNVHLVNAAVFSRNCTLDLYGRGRQSNSIHQVLEDQLSGSSSQYRKLEPVSAKTLDTILVEVGYPVESKSTLVSFEINGAEPEALSGMVDFMKTCPRFDLRIASRYGGGGGNCRERVLEILSAYSNITTIDVEPYIFAYKYHSTA